MLWFLLCSVPGWVIGAGLYIAGIPLSIEWGLMAALIFGLVGHHLCTRRR